MSDSIPSSPTDLMRSRMARLRVDLSAEVPRWQPALDETFEAFSVTLEELQVAEEQLIEVNHSLVATRYELEAERRHYRELLDMASAGYLVTDRHGVISSANAAAAAMLKVPLPFVEGKILSAYINDTDRRPFRDALTDLDRGAEERSWRTTLVPRRGTATLVDVTARPSRLARGPNGSLLWQVRPATEPEPLRLARAYDAAAPARARSEVDDPGLLLGLIDSVPAVIWEADIESGSLRFVSRGCEPLLGFPARAWLDDVGFWAERIHPEDRAMVVSLRLRQRAESSDLEMEYRLVCADGRFVWVRDVSQVEPGSAGGHELLRGFLFNISKRKRLERQLYHAKNDAESRARELSHLQELCLRLSRSPELPDVLKEAVGTVPALLGTTMGAISLYDQERGVLRLAAAVGMPEAFAPVGTEVSPSEGPCGKALTERRSVAVEDLEATDEYPVARETGRVCGFRAVFNTPLVNPVGEVFGVLTCYFVDPHRPAGRQLDLIELYARHVGQGIANARRHEAVREADRRKDEYLKAVGHELLKPLSAMSDALRLVQSASPDEAARAASLEVLGRETAELTRLVDHLIALTRLGSGQLPFPAQSADIDIGHSEAVSGRFASSIDPDAFQGLVEPGTS